MIKSLAGILEVEKDFYGNLGVLDYMEIFPAFRKQGLAKETIRHIVDYFEASGTDYIALMPTPFGQESKK